MAITPNQIEIKRIRKMVGIYNMIPNLFRSIIFFAPPAWFCYAFVPVKSLYILLGISLFAIFLPNSFFDFIQLSRSSHLYKKIGVKYVNLVAQNGSFLNKVLRKKYPGFKTVLTSRTSIQKQYNQTYFFEKFHFSLFLFFVTITVIAIMKQQYWWVLDLTISNLLYNVYPNLLQQYVRVKLHSAQNREL